jgi:Na+/H+ antiporter NhaD/arsenite permease-like protein
MEVDIFSQHGAALAIFVVTYAGVAIGSFPGLAIDRTGIALLGAILCVATGVLSETAALAAIDFPTILLLYGLMVVSSQYRVSGTYTAIALRLTRLMDHPRRFLFLLMLVTANLSAILTNDIVCLAFTPVITVALLEAGLNPLPFLLGIACAANIGSSATIIGNPQNMLIGQVGRLDFGLFLAWGVLPSLAALAAAYGIIRAAYRDNFRAPRRELPERARDWPAFDAHQSRKSVFYTAILVGLFFTPLPREVSALVVAGILLCSRRIRTRAILGFVDWHLITLFIGLFIVVAGMETTGLPRATMAALARHGVEIGNLYLMTGIATLLSNLVSNVPAVMILVKFLDPAKPVEWYVLALSSGYAGNLITIGSIANLIVLEQARQCGVTISFREHLRIGVPVTLASLLVLGLWIVIAG